MLPLFGSEPEIIGIFLFENFLPDTQFNNFHSLLVKKVEPEMYASELQLKTWNLKFSEIFKNDSAKRANNRIAVFGKFFKGNDNTKALNFQILDMKKGIEEGKTIPLSYMEKDDIAQIILLKLKNFLEKSVLGKLNVSSTPLGLNIKLNKKNSGKTPKEFFLKAGRYSLQITGKHLSPFKMDLKISPGKTLNIREKMEFKGCPTKYWLLGSIIATWQLIVIWRQENMLDTSDDKYRYSRYARIGLLGLSGIGWTGTGFCYFSNKSAKKRIFQEIN